MLFSVVGNFGGVEKFICNLGGELTKRKWNVELIFPRSPAEEGLRAWCHEAHLPCTFVSSRFDTNQGRRLGEMTSLVSLLRNRRPDIVHFHYPSSYLSVKDLFAARIAGVDCLASVHGIAKWENRWGVGQMSTYLASRLCQVVTANSVATRQSIKIAGVDKNKVRVIPCGVPQPVFLPTRLEARKRLSIQQEIFTIAVAARLVEQKRIPDVIHAAALFAQTGRPVQVIIAGDGPERGALTRLAGERGVSAHFFGHLSQMDDFYAAADVLTLPSENESFGMVYVEAGLHGVTSIGVNQGGVPDVIEDGVTGFLVMPGDIGQIVDALLLLCDSPDKRRQMGEAARKRSQTHFSVERMTDAFVDLYQRIK